MAKCISAMLIMAVLILIGCGVPHPGITFRIVDAATLIPIDKVVVYQQTYHEGIFDDTYSKSRWYPALHSDGIFHTQWFYSKLAYTFGFAALGYVNGSAFVQDGKYVSGDIHETGIPSTFKSEPLYPQLDGTYLILMHKGQKKG